MKKDIDLKILENADKQTIDTLSGRYVPVSEKERERIFSRAVSKSEAADLSTSQQVHGVDVYTRPRWYRTVRVTAASAALVIGISGSVYAMHKMDKKPEIMTSVSVPEAEVTGIAHTEQANERYSFGDTFSADGFEYCVTYAGVTRCGEGMTPDPECVYNFNTAGDLYLGNSYVVVNMTVTNTAGTDREFTVGGTVWCYNYDVNGEVIEAFPVSGDAPHTYNSDKEFGDEDFLRCTVKAGETHDFRIGYKISDRNLDKSFALICLELTGAEDEADRRYVTLGRYCTLRDLRYITDYDMSTQEGVFYKALNTMDYFDCVSGELMEYDRSMSRCNVVRFQSNINTAMAYSHISMCWMNDPESAISGAEPLLELIDDSDFINFTDGKELYTYNQITKELDYYNGYGPAESAFSRKNDLQISDSQRHIVDSEGIDVWNYRPNLTNVPHASTCLSPQEMIFGFLHDFDNWSIVGNEEYIGRECVVINGVLTGNYSAKLNVVDFTLYIDKETGVLLRYVGTDSSGAIEDFMIVKDIAFGIEADCVTKVDISKLEVIESHVQ